MASPAKSTPTYDYIAYIDEAGDDGLKIIKPIDRPGSSEWLVLGAVVIDASRETEAIGWVRDIVANLRRHQGRGLHFRRLNETNKRLVCAKMAKLRLRCFTVASNKKNMRGYTNPWAAQIPSYNWFYCWLTRLLLERVTYFVKQRAIGRYGEAAALEIELEPQSTP